MSLFQWLGGAGQYASARLWSPRGVPSAGDTAVVGQGEVVVQGGQVGATVDLGGLNAGARPVLDAWNASLAALTMPNGLPAAPYAALTSPAEYGTVNVRGHSAIGRIGLGAFANLDRAPPPYGHGPLFAADALAVNLQGPATLDAGFDVKEGSTLTVAGAAGSSFNVGASTVEGGKVVVNAPLAGQGTITLTVGVVSHEGFADAGTLELGGSVGAGVGIDIDVGKLLIDKPLSFKGTLNIRGSEGSGSPSAVSYVGTQDVMLRGLSASSYRFDGATHALTLFHGDAVLDTIQFSAATTAASFKTGSPYVSVDVVQTAGGVQLRGIMDSSPAGATDIPLRAATG